MEIDYQTTKLKKLCNEARRMTRELGPGVAQALQRRLSQIDAAANLADLAKLPGTRCHELKGTRKGQVAVDVSGAARLVFVPANSPEPRKTDGGLDWELVTSIRIVFVGDYHE